MGFISRHDFEPIGGYEPNLLSDEQIVQLCNQARSANLRANIRSTTLLDTAGNRFFVKFGSDVSLAEARTQHYVAQAVNRQASAPCRVPAVYRFLESNRKGYIAMEFIDGEICSDADARLVAAVAVSFLITINAPNDQPGPGPIGGGLICHDFFVDRKSPVVYSTVEGLSDHINGILEHEEKKLGRASRERVNLFPEVEEYGLRVCPSDMNKNNFMKDREGKIVALDFGATCFLPISFFELALAHPDPFTQLLRPFIDRPKSTQGKMLGQASSSLVKYQDNTVGLRKAMAATK